MKTGPKVFRKPVSEEKQDIVDKEEQKIVGK